VNAVSGPAQIVMLSTSGTFSGGTGGTVCTAAQCTVDGFTLTFSGAPAAPYLAPSLVDLGQFITSFAPTGGSAGLTQFNGVNFVLQVVQTLPSGGVANVSDGITGRLAYNPSASTLVWSPVVTSFSIGLANYNLVTDNTGNINIQAPTTADNPNPTSVKANVSVTPGAGDVAAPRAGPRRLGHRGEDEASVARSRVSRVHLPTTAPLGECRRGGLLLRG
jgi:hypothetical protein